MITKINNLAINKPAQQSDHILTLSLGILSQLKYSDLSWTLRNTSFCTLFMLSPPSHNTLDNVICFIALNWSTVNTPGFSYQNLNLKNKYCDILQLIIQNMAKEYLLIIFRKLQKYCINKQLVSYLPTVTICGGFPPWRLSNGNFERAILSTI